MYVTKIDMLNQRKRIYDDYTFHRQFYKEDNLRTLTPRQKQINTFHVLDIKTDVTQMIHDLEDTIQLTKPRMGNAEMHIEMQAASARLLRIKNGASIYAVAKDASPKYPLIQEKRVAFMTEREAIRPSRTYVVPQVPRQPEFVLPRTLARRNPEINQKQNDFNAFKHRIFEEERSKQNAAIEELNRRNRRRPYALCKQYEDSVKYGLEESHRRAVRAARLSELREKRKESWWPQFLNEIPEGGRSPLDIVYIDMLSNVTEFKESEIRRVYLQAFNKFHNVKKFQDMINRANEIGNFLEPYKLSMIYKEIETGKVTVENCL